MIKYDDLQLIEMGEEYIVISCDSSGGIGNKVEDLIQVEPELAGYFAVMVPMIEIMAIGGEIISVVDTLSVEMEPTGIRIIKGIQQALIEAGISIEALTGSTEDNIKTVMTGIGVTVIGKVSKVNFKRYLPTQGKLVLIGRPKMGQTFVEEEIIGKKGEVLTLQKMQVLAKDIRISDMIPVGSKGIEYEVKNLVKRYNKQVEFDIESIQKAEIDLKISAGPSTCLVAIVAEEYLLSFQKDFPGNIMLGCVVDENSTD